MPVYHTVESDSHHFKRRVNPVEKMYAALPAFLYLNASFVGCMLSPLLDVQERNSSLLYAAQDLGKISHRHVDYSADPSRSVISCRFWDAWGASTRNRA